MIVKSLKLVNFRNHATYELNCQDETSLILGPNGSGKTSVLEALYILTRGKSFRATDPKILKRGTDFYRISLAYASGAEVSATFDGQHKVFSISDQKSRRLPKKHQYPTILFEPSDLNLITHAPSRRRTYFDRIFAQLDPHYSSNLSRYDKALKQRNELLKDENLSPEALFSWNILLAQYGLALFAARQKYLSEIDAKITPVYRSIASTDDQIDLIYQSEVTEKNQQQYLQILESNFTRDHLLGHTTFGIHHDDYLFNFNQEPAADSASRGESRTIILALKFIEADLIFQKTSQRPLILLDDVFSELDDSRRQSLINNFKDHQIILTSVENITL